MNDGLKLEAHDISLSYKRKNRSVAVLSNFNYTFETRKVYLVKGSSGSGKTTLLSILALIQNSDSGQIRMNGQRVDHLSNEEKCKIRRETIGIAFQEPNFIQGLSVKDNIVLTSMCEKLADKKTVYSKCEEITQILKINDKMEAKPNELSGGERQRANIARAVISNPDIVICDEPVANLDEENGNIIVDFLQKYSKEHNKTVIISCHTNNFDTIADEVIQM